jgi:hypothetical protein
VNDWLPIAGYGDRYQVSASGLIRRIPFIDAYGHRQKEKVLRASYGNGYATVYVAVNQKKFGILLHRAMALAFIPNPDNLPHINHIDGDRRNNALSNLEWVTPSGNIMHAKRIGLWRQKLSDDDVREIRRLHVPRPGPGRPGGNTRDLAQRFGVTPVQVMNVVSRKQWPWLI